MNGKIEICGVRSEVLRNNPLRDPALREVPVYLPPSYDRSPQRRYPVVYYLAGFTGMGKMMLNVHPWKENLVERLDRLIVSGTVRDCLLVLPDCFTRYGGSQYVNSRATGRYEDHVVREVVAYVDRRFRTMPEASRRAVMGKSSGGFGALWLGMRHPGVFSHVACHSGDMFFEMCYGVDIPKCINALARYGGVFAKFLRAFNAAQPRRREAFPHELVNMAAMASCYSPDSKSSFGLKIPFDERTGEIIPRIWGEWLQFDPARAASRYARNLKRLRTLYLDCGTKDEFYLHLGARKFSRELTRLGVRHMYEEHDKGHFDMAERYDVSLKRISVAFRRT